MLTIRVSRIITFSSFNFVLVESFSGCFTKDGLMDWTAVSIFNAVLRPWWSAAVCSMIILCDLRYGYLINWFLSSKPFLFLSKLSFGMYLLHYNLIGLLQARFALYTTNSTLPYIFHEHYFEQSHSV